MSKLLRATSVTQREFYFREVVCGLYTIKKYGFRQRQERYHSRFPYPIIIYQYSWPVLINPEIDQQNSHFFSVFDWQNSRFLLPWLTKFTIFLSRSTNFIIFLCLFDKICYFSTSEQQNLLFFYIWSTKFMILLNPINKVCIP